MTLDDLLSTDLPVPVLRRGLEVLLDEARREGEMAAAESLMDISAIDREESREVGRVDGRREAEFEAASFVLELAASERAEIEARAKVDLLREQREERLRWRERGTPPVDPVAAAAFLRALLNTDGGDDE